MGPHGTRQGLRRRMQRERQGRDGCLSACVRAPRAASSPAARIKPLALILAASEKAASQLVGLVGLHTAEAVHDKVRVTGPDVAREQRVEHVGAQGRLLQQLEDERSSDQHAAAIQLVGANNPAALGLERDPHGPGARRPKNQMGLNTRREPLNEMRQCQTQVKSYF